jgi:predicted 3-demethylubiquinone-9 3-methyltransferase (glyoxalase superfamily)
MHLRDSKITPFLWIEQGADQAVARYLRLFGDGRVLRTQHWPEGSPAPAGSVMTVQFELFGRPYTVFNGGPHFKLNEAFSLVVECDDQHEIDRLWEGLIEGGGTPSRCGWLKDPWGLSWQILPRRFLEMLRDPDPARVGRVFEAMMPMTKFDQAALEAAYAGAQPT